MKINLYSVLSFLLLLVSNTNKAQDDKLAPNSFIFDVNSSNDGLYIPVKKAYAMWENNGFLATPIPSGSAKAFVYWEDQHGLIKSDADYELSMTGVGEDAIIKVPVNKHKKGNAVISYEVNNVTYWSWHVWVTDDPTQDGAQYISYSSESFKVQKRLSDNTVQDVSPNEWKWMDRNLGAISAGLTGPEWTKNGGLLYQWGRKDPIPPLATKGDDFYEVSGKAGRIRHRGAANPLNNALKIDDFTKNINRSTANVNYNIQTSVHNPLSLIYVVNDNTTNQAYYNNNANLPLNWFGTSANYSNDKLGQLNLWSDNSKGNLTSSNPNNNNYNSQRQPYNNKSSFDPCPNGWRVPSMLVNSEGGWDYQDNVRTDYSPFGYKIDTPNKDLNTNILPTNTGMDTYKHNIKLYPQIGFDLKNVNTNNMGVFPGTGAIDKKFHLGQYTDQHHTMLWTSTMTRWFDTSPAVNARAIVMIPDAGQSGVPDPNFPNVKGKFIIGTTKDQTANAYGVRCIKDPLYMSNNYDFPTTYFTETSIPRFEAGLDDPNTYDLVKSSVVQTVNIPIRKAFSVNSNLLDNPGILNTSSFNDLKVNVLWTTNQNLLQDISLSSQPTTLSAIDGTNILVNINPNQSGNAIVSLHNGDINNPVLWSWHIWVTNSPLKSIIYKNDIPENSAVNYVNYTKKGTVMLTEIMDRNLGALDILHYASNPNNLSNEDIERIKNSGGLQYQWGRKDPLPSFTNPDGSAYNIYLGNHSGSNISYTTLNSSQYDSSYTEAYNSYSANSGVISSDPIATKVAKVLRYAANHPLQYLKPSDFAPASGLNTNGTDWVSPSGEPNLAADRWGRGGKKSPFDPCPAGWRIPDVYSSSTSAQFSTMPWSLANIDATAPNSITGTYSGTIQNSSGSLFRNSNFKIGNIPFVGIRGWRTVLSGGAADFNISSRFTGIWTASLNSNYLGRAIALVIDRTANNLIPYSPAVDPYFAMSCRCVKIRIDNGNEIGPILTDDVNTYNQITDYDDEFGTLSTEEQNANTNRIMFYPNPTTDILNFSEEISHLKLTDFSGKVVMQIPASLKSINIAHLPSGVYLLTATSKVGKTLTSKVIKK